MGFERSLRRLIHAAALSVAMRTDDGIRYDPSDEPTEEEYRLARRIREIATAPIAPPTEDEIYNDWVAQIAAGEVAKKFAADHFPWRDWERDAQERMGEAMTDYVAMAWARYVDSLPCTENGR
jgi:hypothetical protein